MGVWSENDITLIYLKIVICFLFCIFNFGMAYSVFMYLNICVVIVHIYTTFTSAQNS